MALVTDYKAKMDRVSNAVPGHLVALDAMGNAVDSGHATTEISGAGLGNLADLDPSIPTASRVSAVAAINYVLSVASQAINNIGTMSSLPTTDKSSIVAAINELHP